MTAVFGSRHFPTGAPLALVDTYAKALNLRGAFPAPVGDVKVSVLGQTLGGSFKALPEPATALFQRSPGGNFNLTGKLKMATGELLRLEDGDFRFAIESQFYRTAVQDVTLDSDKTQRVQIDLKPNTSYPFPQSSLLASVSGPARLLGALHTAAGAPLEEVNVTVTDLPAAWEFRSYRTGKKGEWMIVFPDEFFRDSANPQMVTVEKQVSVEVDIASPPVVLANVKVVAGKETGLVETSLRGRVAGARGAPVADAEISVSGRPATARTNSSGDYFYFFPLTQGQETVTVTATAPSGAQLSQSVPLVVHGCFIVPTFRLA